MKRRIAQVFMTAFLLAAVYAYAEEAALALGSTGRIRYWDQAGEEELPYWPQVEALIQSYLTDDVYVTINGVNDTWSENDRDMEAETEWVYEIYLCYNDYSDDDYESVMDRALVVLNHTIEMDKQFKFFIWLESDGEAEVLKTDFPQQLYSYMLAETTYDFANEALPGFLIGNSPSESNYAIPYYELMEEPLVLETVLTEYGEENVEAVWRVAYGKMHDWQSKITGDLSQNIRFCDGFLPENETYYIEPEKPREDLDQQEFTNWISSMSVQGYWNWVEKFGSFFPEHRISFTEPYGPEQEELFAEFEEERELYRVSLENTGTDEIDIEEENSWDIYVVQKGDTLWDIAKWYYGDGRYCINIWNDNRELIGNDMNHIMPGIRLRIN